MEKIECKHCGKKFDNSKALEQHINTKHFHKTEVVKQKQKIKLGKIVIYGLIFLVVAGLGFLVYLTLTSTSSMGALGSTHIHAIFGLFLDGREITPLPTRYFVKSQYVHVESGDGAATGRKIHIHATNVPLELFFKSIGMEFSSECFELDTGDRYCNDGKTLKMFVKHAGSEWEMNNEMENYIYKDGDKILISYGNETEEELKQQMQSVDRF